MFFFFSSRRRHTRFKCDWSSDVCSSDLTSVRESGYEFQRGYVRADYVHFCESPLCATRIEVELLDQRPVYGEFAAMRRFMKTKIRTISAITAVIIVFGL